MGTLRHLSKKATETLFPALEMTGVATSFIYLPMIAEAAGMYPIKDGSSLFVIMLVAVLYVWFIKVIWYDNHLETVIDDYPVFAIIYRIIGIPGGLMLLLGFGWMFPFVERRGLYIEGRLEAFIILWVPAIFSITVIALFVLASI